MRESLLAKAPLLVRYATRVAMAAGVVVSSLTGEWVLAFIGACALLADAIPRMFLRGYGIRLPIEFDLALTAFVFATLFLGEVLGFYVRVWWWDKMLHGASGVMLGFTGFLILFAFLLRRRMVLSAALLAVFSLSFGIAVGAVWEIIEFAADKVFGADMQNSLDDTMFDLIYDSLGAAFAALGGYIYLRNSITRIGWFEFLLGRYLDHNPPAPSLHEAQR